MAGLCVRGGSARHRPERWAHFAFAFLLEQKRARQPLGPERGLSEAPPQGAAFEGTKTDEGGLQLYVWGPRGWTICWVLAWPGLAEAGLGNGSLVHSSMGG